MTEARNRALLTWYGSNRRALPWRETREPWRILVSEVMLQQTGVGRVEPVYRRFVDRFPNPSALASAPLAEAILAWEDLGYQRRVVNLRKAAAEVTAAGWPTTPESLRRLPGVGPYTAAAVACFAFGHAAPAVDTNLRRVISRWVGAALDRPAVASRAVSLLDRRAPADWNQAIMDLGASVCRPVPRCERCPVSSWCADPSIRVAGRAQGRYEGSVRQARASVMKALAADGSTWPEQLAVRTGLSGDTVDPAVRSLEAEGLVTIREGIVALVD